MTDKNYVNICANIFDNRSFRLAEMVNERETDRQTYRYIIPNITWNLGNLVARNDGKYRQVIFSNDRTAGEWQWI